MDDTKRVGELSRDSEIQDNDIFNSEHTVKVAGITPGALIADRYEIVDFLGEGGMGSVYKARHTLIGNLVAIKFLHPHLLKDAASLERFKTEVKAAINLRHDHLMSVSDYGVAPSGQPFIVMDYVEGRSLDDILTEQKHLPIDEFYQIFAQVCDGLSHAHQKGVVHRDIKPSNIMLSKTEKGEWNVHIVDFGIAKVLPRGRGAVQHLTQTGEVFGSPLYMSPEQCKGRPVDERSDVYSLGCVMFEALTAHPPHKGESAIETLMCHVNQQPPRLSEKREELRAETELENITAKCLAAEPDDRYKTTDELRADLIARKYSGKPIPVLPPAPSHAGHHHGPHSHQHGTNRQQTGPLPEVKQTTVPELRSKVIRDTFINPMIIAGVAAATVWLVSTLNVKPPAAPIVGGINEEKLREADLGFRLATERASKGFTQEAAEISQKALDIRAKLAPDTLILAESENQRADIALKDAEHESSLLRRKPSDTASDAKVSEDAEARKKTIVADYALAERLLLDAIKIADAKAPAAKRADAPVRFRNNLTTAYLDQNKFKFAEQTLQQISDLYLNQDPPDKSDPDSVQKNFHELFDGQYERLYWGFGRDLDAAKLHLEHHQPDKAANPRQVSAEAPFSGIWSYGTFSMDLHQSSGRVSGKTPALNNETQKPGEAPNAILGDINGPVAHLTITNTSDVKVNAVAVQVENYLVFHVSERTQANDDAGYIPDDAILSLEPARVPQSDSTSDKQNRSDPSQEQQDTAHGQDQAHGDQADKGDKSNGAVEI